MKFNKTVTKLWVFFCYYINIGQVTLTMTGNLCLTQLTIFNR